MSKIYYDHILVMDDVEEHIHLVAETPEEKEELWQLVDEIVHREMMGCVLDHLHEDHHDEFLGKFEEAPHSHDLLDYIDERIEGDIEKILEERVELLKSEILEELGNK